MKIGDYIVKTASQNVPITKQLKDAISKLIQDGTFPPGASLPSIRQLSADNQISPLTARNVYETLAEDGIIKVIHGKGSFVAEHEDLAREKAEYEIAQAFSNIEKNYKSLGISSKELKKIVETHINQKLTLDLDTTINKALDQGFLPNEILDIFEIINTNTYNHTVKE